MMLSDLLSHVFLILLLIPGLVSADQKPLLTTPEAELSMSEFTALSLSQFPSHKIRVKKTPALCEDEKVAASYSGYLDVGNDKHFFFWWFESRNDPAKDDVIMWINGGPGCSSMVGLLVELGPCRINEHGNGTVPNPYSWSNNASVFFLDQPIGTGFSYSSSGESVGTTFAASDDVNAFLKIWKKQFPKYKNNAFHIAGESYAGHYIPVFAADALKKGDINLKSVMIGNGYFSEREQASSVWDMTCTTAAGIEPILDEKTCKKMASSIQRCNTLLDACYAYPVTEICDLAEDYCSKNLARPFHHTGRNPYDLSQKCTDWENLCFPTSGLAQKYLNRKDVRKQLGVDNSFGKFHTCSNPVYKEFIKSGDELVRMTPQVVYLLEKGLRVLIYAGEYDWICNWVGIQNWLTSMSFGWKGAPYFRALGNRPWFVGDVKAGMTRRYEGLTWVTIAKAGHMVPIDKPAESLEMVRRWLKGEDM